MKHAFIQVAGLRAGQDNIDRALFGHNWSRNPIPESVRQLEKDLTAKLFAYGAGINDYGQKVFDHSRRVAEDTELFLLHRGIDPEIASIARQAVLLHDIGKMHESFSIEAWALPHAPSAKEKDHRDFHSKYGPEILAQAASRLPTAALYHPFVQIIAPGIMAQHHERMDGKGHRGLKGEELGLLTRIVCITDYIDGAMAPKNAAKAGLSLEEALEKMRTSEKYRTAFDPEILALYADYRGAAISAKPKPSAEVSSQNMVRALALSQS